MTRSPYSVFRIFDWHAALVTALALAATWLCVRYSVDADLPSELIAIAVVFPTAFGIGAAHRRREEALDALSSMRAMIASIYYAHRDWGAPDHAARGARMGMALYRAVCAALACAWDERPMARLIVAERFSDLSNSLESLEKAGVSGAKVSRAQQFLNNAIRNFERLRTIAEYRTAGSLRLYSKIFLNSLPVLFAPSYAHLAIEYGAGFGYAVAVAFALVLVGLDNIQDGLENPFDSLGEDDVRLDDDSEPFWLGEGASAAIVELVETRQS